MPRSIGRPRRDPYWGFDGTTARSQRRSRRLIASFIVALCVAILILTFVRLTSVNPGVLVNGPNRLVVLASLAGDVAACLLVFARESRVKRAIRSFVEHPVDTV